MITIQLLPLKWGYHAVIDDTDAPLVAPYVWTAKITKKKNGRIAVYATRWTQDAAGNRRRIMMHADLLGFREGCEIDHRNGDTLNNRRGNLRFASREQNQWNAGRRLDNTSGFKGATYDASTRGTKKWKASIQYRGKRKTIGRFTTAEEAADAYDAEAIRLFGEFARPNCHRVDTGA